MVKVNVSAQAKKTSFCHRSVTVSTLSPSFSSILFLCFFSLVLFSFLPSRFLRLRLRLVFFARLRRPSVSFLSFLPLRSEHLIRSTVNRLCVLIEGKCWVFSTHCEATGPAVTLNVLHHTLYHTYTHYTHMIYVLLLIVCIISHCIVLWVRVALLVP